ncbi:MAG: YjfB family protein [Lachnospiraceae bacterium]|nr:YjfB family protein [Lachnospiraceae bacterium]
MNIPELSTALSNVQAANQVSVAVLVKALESAEATGAGILNMMDRSMELSVNPNIGSNIDIFV